MSVSRVSRAPAHSHILTLEGSLAALRPLTTRNALDLWRGSTNEDLYLVCLTRRRQVLRDDLGGNVSLEGTLACSLESLGQLVETVDDLESVVGLCKLVELFAEQDVVFGLVGVDEGYFGLVRLVVGNVLHDSVGGGKGRGGGEGEQGGKREAQGRLSRLYSLPHRRNPRSTSNHTDVLELVCLVRELGDGSLDANRLSWLEVVDVVSHSSILVLLDEEVHVTLGRGSRDGRVGANDLLAILVLETFLAGALEDDGGGRRQAGLCVGGKLEDEAVRRRE